MRNCSLSGAPQKPEPRAMSKPTCVRQKRQRMPLALRQPRKITKQRWLSTKKSETITGHAVVDGSRSKPRAIPMMAIRASDSHVAWRESMNLTTALCLQERYMVPTRASHNITTKILSGKRNISIGTSITGDKGSLIFRKTDYSTSKI